MCVNILDLAFFFLRGGGCVVFFSNKKKILRSVLHLVPLFDGDERVEMQGMIYDLASFTCERQNALLIIEDLRWVTMDRGWHLTIFQLPSGVAVCWLTCPRKTLSLYSMGWTRVHSSPWGTSKRLCLFGQRVCLVWSDMKFYICAALLYCTNHLSLAALSIDISLSRFVDTCIFYSLVMLFCNRAC